MSDRCPLCEGPNHCAMADGAPNAARCWCMITSVPAALVRRAQTMTTDVCICAACVTRYKEQRAGEADDDDDE